jgi:hypothetical protein
VAVRPRVRVFSPWDVDVIRQADTSSNTIPTYAVLTARSDQAGVVKAAMMAGSVQTFADGIEMLLWRALFTRAGNENSEPFNK